MNSKEQKKNVGNRKQTYDIYVGHVPRALQEGMIEQVFSEFGEIIDVLYRFGSGSYGYAIVKFKHQSDADRVLEKVDSVRVSGYEMEVKNGKRSNPSVENGIGATAVSKTVTFADLTTSAPPIGNVHFIEPAFHDDRYAAYAHGVNEQCPIMVEIMCTHVENAVTFHGCPTNRYHELDNLSRKLNSICSNLQPLLRKPALKRVYGALYSVDNAWYRCSVIQCTVPSKPGVCIVHYIDYGNIAEVSYTDMVELPEPIKNLAPFAVKCVFANLMCSPKSNKETYLHGLIYRRMSLYALTSWATMEYQVLKCSCNGIDIVAELLRTGCAMHRAQMSTRSPPLNNRPDKVANFKPHANHKAKKSNKACSKKAVDSCNGLNKNSSEVNNNERTCDPLSLSYKNSSSDESQHAQDVTPKRIIKRGSVITDAMNLPVLERAKTVNNLLKVDCVISSLKLVNNIRGLVPLPTDDDLINNAVDLLKNEVNVTETCDSKSMVEKAYEKYCETLKDLKECSNQELLKDLKDKRNLHRTELHKELKQFLDSFDYSLLEKRKKIQEIITSLVSNSNAWMNIYLSETPKTIEDLLTEYNKEKEKKKSSVQKARKNTNDKHQKFMKFFNDLGKEFSLNMVHENTDESYFNSTGGKRGSWALKFEETLTDLGIALEEEERSTSTNMQIKDRNHVSVIDFILKKLDVPKEKIDTECELLSKYQALYDDLNYTSDLSPVFEQLYALKKSIQAMSCNFVCNGDVDKTNNILLELHSALLKEDVLLENLAKASSLHFPEFVLEHPDLKLHDYQKNFNLLKNSWEERFFPSFENCLRVEPSYVSKLANESVVIKEFKVGCDSNTALLKKAATWNEIKSKSLVKIKGLFSNKDGNIVYAVLPPVWETLYDKPLTIPVDYKKGLSLLQQILIGLCDLHSRGLAHGAVHPIAILHKDGQVLLDFNFDRKYLQPKFCLKGINFKPPSAEDLYRSADMYGFGCLVLWVLFPNLSFSSTADGIPDINAFQSIIQDMLSMKDFTALSSLLNVNQDLRPTSRVLLSNGFLKDLRIMSETLP